MYLLCLQVSNWFASSQRRYDGPLLFIWLFLLACQHPSGCFGYESSHQLVTPSDPTLSGGFFLCIKVLPFTVRDYTGPIVLSTDTNAYLAVSFICNSAWAMTMKSYDGWQSFEPVVQNSQKVNNIVIKRALQEKCCIVLFIFRFCHCLTSSFHPLFSNRLRNCSYFPRLRASCTGLLGCSPTLLTKSLCGEISAFIVFDPGRLTDSKQTLITETLTPLYGFSSSEETKSYCSNNPVILSA